MHTITKTESYGIIATVGLDLKHSVWPLAILVLMLWITSSALADYPLTSHRYIADPAALEYNGRLYLYGSNDSENTGNNYDMHSIVCISTDDLKNWTDHGPVLQVPRDASWAIHAWAPSVIARNNKIYLYFANNASGIGVAVGDSPTGPFTDARGSALINFRTPGAPGINQWYFDPCVFVDDDGQVYLFFGGNNITNARVVRLNDDLISLAGPAVSMGTVPNFFEASYLHKRNGIYYFSYENIPSAGLAITYGMGFAPTSGFAYQPNILSAPSNFNNNHHAFFTYQGEWYAAYHNRYASGGMVYKRNLCLDRLNYNPDGTIQRVIPTLDGLAQLKPLNPYLRVEAETIAQQSGILTEACAEGGMNVTSIGNGDWIRVRGVDFQDFGASQFIARVASAVDGGEIELRLDGAAGPLIGSCAVPVTGGSQNWTITSCTVDNSLARGVHDLYLRFTGGGGDNLFTVNWWQFGFKFDRWQFVR
ncbi:MAG TPA: glycoside hydrolase family 43 protein [Blastocatellia bacterium]|nr:glycoside hydrolase family 43 protein [Blastocatellia bacterium]